MLARLLILNHTPQERLLILNHTPQDGCSIQQYHPKIWASARCIHAQLVVWGNLREQIFHRNKIDARGSIRKATECHLVHNSP